MEGQEPDLRAMREAARISQAAMADHLGVSQSQVSRYESDPDEMSLGLYRKWTQLCGDVSTSRPVDVGDPMAGLRARFELVANYLETEPEPSEGIDSDELKRKSDVTPIQDAIETLRHAARKPRVGVMGQFDMGKTRLANMLLGENHLPTQYQPATRLPCLIRHMEDKPAWQQENVWIMKKGFSLDRPDDEEHCTAHRLIAGGYEALSEHASYIYSSTTQFADADAAIVYIDSPFLKGCDLLDLPGYANNEGDDSRAEMAHSLVDAVIYVSLAQGFIDQYDRQYIEQLLQNLPVYSDSEGISLPLRNLFIVATRADLARDSLEHIKEKASANLYDVLEPTLEDWRAALQVDINEETLRNRVFTSSAENPELCAPLEEDLVEFLGTLAPQATMRDCKKTFDLVKESNKEALDGTLTKLKDLLEKQEQAQSELESLLEQEPERKAKRDEHESRVLSLIDRLGNESVDEAEAIYTRNASVDQIEATISSRYKDKKVAKKNAPSYIVNDIQHKVGRMINGKSEKLSEEVNKFLADYDSAVEGYSIINDGWTFNAKGAFMGGLAGLGTFGALAGWASAAAAGSNLGGYILAAQVTSMLSSIGITIGGGTATVMTVLATFGGPFAIGVGIAVAIGTIAGLVFGDSWQRSLAKRINKKLNENRAERKILDEIQKYWKATREAFTHAAEETERDFQDHLATLRKWAYETNPEALSRQIEYLETLRNFFSGMPWKNIGN